MTAGEGKQNHVWQNHFFGDPPTRFAATAFSFDAMAALPRKWVKPEVDPPRIGALPRGSCSGGSMSAGERIGRIMHGRIIFLR
jgi:hypothetical protein